ncbi:class I SAM-dependent methyltransferase [Methylophilus sp.]|uniref:class I SAM-dependent methyltransferase n=1 Tax=Methylophilus sp. TaxID=29541 RepID=UPI0040361F3E
MTTQLFPFVKESRFGDWFLNTDMWKIRVLERALNDVQRFIPPEKTQFETILDIGCGFGHAFESLSRRFSPTLLIGVDADPDIQARAGAAAERCSTPVRLCHANAAAMHEIADNQVDMIFCHQTFHHIVEQEAAMQEFFRILKPNGLLVFAESTKYYIETLQIRLLFRHPMEVQRTADEYAAIIRNAGFSLPPERISLPFLWWSRPDCGMLEWLGFSVPQERKETLINAVAVKPA